MSILLLDIIIQNISLTKKIMFSAFFILGLALFDFKYGSRMIISLIWDYY